MMSEIQRAPSVRASCNRHAPTAVELKLSDQDLAEIDTILQNAFRGDDFSVATANRGIVQMRRVRSDGDELRGLTVRFDRDAIRDVFASTPAIVMRKTIVHNARMPG